MLDSNGDWTLNFQQDNNAVIMQNIQTRLKEWKGDCFFNSGAGIDWANRLGKNQQNGLAAEIKNVIVKTQGVAQILSFSINFDSTNRIFTVNSRLRTIFSSSVEANFVL